MTADRWFDETTRIMKTAMHLMQAAAGDVVADPDYAKNGWQSVADHTAYTLRQLADQYALAGTGQLRGTVVFPSPVDRVV